MYMKEKFIEWLKNRKRNNGEPYSKETISNYIKALEQYSSKLDGISLKSKDLFNIDDLNDFNVAKEIICNHADYEQLNIAYHRVFSSALQMYQFFLQCQENTQTDIGNYDSFKQWMQTYPDKKYRDSTINRYLVALDRAEERLAIKLPNNIWKVKTIDEYQSIFSIITQAELYESVNKKYGNGDLSAALSAYKKFISSKGSSPIDRIGSFYSWDIISETVAQKHCDKSFFTDNGSGVPKEICWFFDAENIQPGEKKKIKLWYGLQHSFTGHLSNDSTDRRRVRIFWDADLGKRFDIYKDRPDAVAKFTKKDADTYEISFEEGEKEMTVKDQLAQIKEYIAMKGFSYEGNLIDNFWLSLKSKPFVLLAGTSGTGKTRLVRLFAEAIGATNENGRYKLVSVRPDWSDSSDLFGHVDLNGHFVPGAIIDFVKKAELDPEYPYFLCLDEMNLARVEYYLSDFLSVIETRGRKDGTIVTDPLVSPSCYGRDAVAAGKYGKVILPENLYVIGTVNMDETTFPFSRKVLDRANTIEFSFVKLNELPGSDAGDVDALNLGNEFLKTEYLSLKECMSEDANFQVLCDKLEEINLILAKAGAHVGYRVRDEIVFYLLNNKKNGLLSAEEAFDNEIMQKILPRIQGSSTSVKNMLCDLFHYCAGDYTGLGGSSDSEQMQAYIDQKSAGKYPRSAEKIVFMTRRFEEDGFTSYWL